LTGAAHEGQALRIFVGTGTFPYKHQAGVGIAVGEDNLVAALKGERAAGAIADFGADRFEGSPTAGGWDDTGNKVGRRRYGFTCRNNRLRI
jgi:hypothetical protein